MAGGRVGGFPEPLTADFSGRGRGFNVLSVIGRPEWAIKINLRKVLMSDTSQIALIRKLYDARGNVNIFKSLLADDLEYDIAEGFPNGGVYRGIDTVVNDFFTFFADFDEFYAKGDEYFESGDHVIVLGRYFGVTLWSDGYGSSLGRCARRCGRGATWH